MQAVGKRRMKSAKVTALVQHAVGAQLFIDSVGVDLITTAESKVLQLYKELGILTTNYERTKTQLLAEISNADVEYAKAVVDAGQKLYPKISTPTDKTKERWNFQRDTMCFERVA
jgi:hypothetical protein